MHIKKLLRQLAIMMLSASLAAACASDQDIAAVPKQPAPGQWTAATDFGEFRFTVTSVRLKFV